MEDNNSDGGAVNPAVMPEGPTRLSHQPLVLPSLTLPGVSSSSISDVLVIGGFVDGPSHLSAAGQRELECILNVNPPSASVPMSLVANQLTHAVNPNPTRSPPLGEGRRSGTPGQGSRQTGSENRAIGRGVPPARGRSGRGAGMRSALDSDAPRGDARRPPRASVDAAAQLESVYRTLSEECGKADADLASVSGKAEELRDKLEAASKYAKALREYDFAKSAAVEQEAVQERLDVQGLGNLSFRGKPSTALSALISDRLILGRFLLRCVLSGRFLLSTAAGAVSVRLLFTLLGRYASLSGGARFYREGWLGVVSSALDALLRAQAQGWRTDGLLVAGTVTAYVWRVWRYYTASRVPLIYEVVPDVLGPCWRKGSSRK